MSEQLLPQMPMEAEQEIAQVIKRPSRLKRIGLFAVKLCLTALAIWIVVQQADIIKIRDHIFAMSAWHLALALMFLLAASAIGGLRMRAYFQLEGVKMGSIFSVMLQMVGGFFSLFLPGGIGGDGYKAYYIRRYFGFSLAHAIRLMVVIRANGLFSLLLASIAMAVFSRHITELPGALLFLGISTLILVPSYSMLSRYILKESVKAQMVGTPYSMAIQLLVAASAYMLVLGFPEAEGHRLDYVILFVLSSIMLMVPVSVGGVGMRELVFLYASDVFGLSEELGIALALIFTVLNMGFSLAGCVCYYTLGRVDPKR